MISLCRALEQYFIFTIKPTLNTSVVARGKITGPATSDKLKPLYIYNSEKTKLVCITNSRDMGISYSSLREYLKSDKPKLGNFVYSRVLDSSLRSDLKDPLTIASILAEAKKNRYVKSFREQLQLIHKK